MGSKILDALSVPAFDLAQRFVSRRSDERAERMGARLGLLAYRLDKKHRLRTINNLELGYPEWGERKRDDVAKEVFRHFGRMWVQFMRTPSRTHETVLATTEVVGLENLERAESAKKGVLLVTGHFGNWEWSGQWVAASGRKLTVVQRDANQGGINDRITQLRKDAGMDVMSRGNAARGILARLKRDEQVGLLIDQNAGDAFVPFYGKPCGTVNGPAVLHLRTQAPILPTYSVRLGPGRYRLEFHPPIEATPGEDPVLSITSRLNEDLEEIVRRHPEQWLWMHDRWKSARQQGLL